MDPDERRRHLGLAVMLLEAGRWPEALSAAEALAASSPHDVEAMLLAGLAAAGGGQTARAAEILQLVARARPGHAHPCRDFAGLAAAAPEAVCALFRACLALRPTDARLRRDFAGFLLDHGEPAEALAIVRRAAECAAGCNLMGMAYAELGRFEAAIAAFQRAVRLDPEPSMGWSNLGLVLKATGRHEAAIAAYHAAVARSPDDAQIRVNRAVALLHAGRWTEAWDEYEWRLRLPGHASLRLDRLLPSLDRLGDLHGVTILAQHEEGFGDTLQFMRYLPLLAARGARVVAMVPAPLIRVLRRVAGVAAVLPADAPVPAYDYHCPFFSLARVFASTVETVPHGN
jgi:tetratricopeptide (TPR) repeat protein